MKALPLFGLFALLTVLPVRADERKPAPQPEPLHPLFVRLLDGDHKPVVGAHVGENPNFVPPERLEPKKADPSGLMYDGLHAVSDQSGLARIDYEGETAKLLDYWGHFGLVAHHAGRHLVAFVLLDAAWLKTAGATAANPIEITLVPECRVTGRVECPELAKRGRKTGTVAVYVSSGPTQMLWSTSSLEGNFHFVAPPGRYDLLIGGTYVPFPRLTPTLTIPAGKRELELTFRVAPKKFALLMGHPAPELRDIAAWKNSPPLKLADLKGKCILLEFWGHWCGPCVGRMPQTMELYDRYKQQGLVVIGVHVEVTDQGIDTVEKLDAKLAGARQRRWHGRDIPFPVALARSRVPQRSAVDEDYQVGIWPTLILIDRRGNVVDAVNPNVSLTLLEKALAEKPGGETRGESHSKR